ncbi:unnamed protein product, partial [Staurois parvus]
SPRVPRGGREGVSSQRRRADLSCTCPLSGAAKARNRKLETGTRLHNEAWSAGAAAPSIICPRRSPHRNFSSHLVSGRVAFSSPAIQYTI